MFTFLLAITYFTGGIRRAVGYEMKLLLDGSESYDPDSSKTDKSGMKFYWYCKRKEESFTKNYVAANMTDGCFGNGQFNLTEPSQSLMSTTVKQIFLTLSFYLFIFSWHMRSTKVKFEY